MIQSMADIHAISRCGSASARTTTHLNDWLISLLFAATSLMFAMDTAVRHSRVTQPLGKLVSNPTLRVRLREETCRRALRDYSPESIGRALDSMHRSQLDRRLTSPVT